MFGTPATAATPSANPKRFGCYAAKIGFMFAHRLEQNLTLPSGRFLGKGQLVHLNIQDITRHPEAEPHLKWVCMHPACIGTKWESKRALVAGHRPNKDLAKDEETHCYHAVAYVPGVAASAAKLAKDGSILEPEVKQQLPSVMLFSDEE